MKISSFDFEYLRPGSEIVKVQHQPEYIKSTLGKKGTRKIFHDVSFDTFEVNIVEDFEEVLKEQGVILPEGWNMNETLKYLYSTKFNFKESALLIKDCLTWREDPRSYTLTPEVLDILHSGLMYIWGVDCEHRPIITINLNKKSLKEINEEAFKSALFISFDILRSYCFVPAKVENWIVIVDAQNIQTLDLHKIKLVTHLMKSCFPSSLEKLFIISSSSLLDRHWDALCSIDYKDSLSEAILLSNNDLSKLKTYIPQDSLEEKYGGNCPNLVNFWPPPQRLKGFKRLSSWTLNQSTGHKSNDNSIRNEQDNNKKENSDFALNESIFNASQDSVVDLNESVFPLENPKNTGDKASERKYNSMTIKLEQDNYNLGGTNDATPRHTTPAIFPSSEKDGEFEGDTLFNKTPKWSTRPTGEIINDPTEPVREFSDSPIKNDGLFPGEDKSPHELDLKSEIIELDTSALNEPQHKYKNLTLENILNKFNAIQSPSVEVFNRTIDSHHAIVTPNTKHVKKDTLFKLFKHVQFGGEDSFTISPVTQVNEKVEEGQTKEHKKKVSFGIEESYEERSSTTLPKSSPTKSSMKSTGKFFKRFLPQTAKNDGENEDDKRGFFCGLCFNRSKPKNSKAV